MANFHSRFRQIVGRNQDSRPNTRTSKRVMVKFADKMGFLYFGSVNQHNDDHHIVRGFTVSSTHSDSHYSVGVVDDYEITVVDRTDQVRGPDSKKFKSNWLIVEIKLKSTWDIPHTFIGAVNHDPRPYYTLFSTFPGLKEVDMGTFETYGDEFTNRFAIYAKPTQSIEVERLFPASTARVIGENFWPFSAEIHERTIYMYADNERVTATTLESLTEAGIWLAKHIDYQVELV